MKVYNQDKTQILEEYDLELGKLVKDTIKIKHPEVKAVEEKGHYETVAEYENGGKDVKWVIDVAGVEYQPAREETEEIYIYVPYTDEELKNIQIEKLRRKREIECFSVVNRGKLWYDKLKEEQVQELDNWYMAWLDITETLVEPQKPDWL